jgi:hypothetical protein
LVHHAVETLNGPRRRALLSLSTPLCCLALLSGCGASASKPWAGSLAAHGVGESIRLANCTDWRKGTDAERRKTVAELREFAGGQVGSSVGIQRGPVLLDKSAYVLFEKYCANYFARGFKLYKLYTRSAAFGGH